MKGVSLSWDFSGLEGGLRVSDRNYVGIEDFSGFLGRGIKISDLGLGEVGGFTKCLFSFRLPPFGIRGSDCERVAGFFISFLIEKVPLLNFGVNILGGFRDQ